MTEIVVRCGTRYPEMFTVDLNEYGEAKPTDADDATWYRALNLLIATMNDLTFADNGHRNDDAVNACIALHVMGYDALAWFDNWREAQSDKRFWRADLDKFMEHVVRVSKYLSKWGPKGNESNALNFAIG